VGIVASQLTGVISITGAAQGKADILSVGSASQTAQADLTQLQNAAKDVSSILSSRMSAELKNAQSGLQDLAVRADAAGLDVSKFASLQMQAAESSARLGVAQAQAAAAMEKANLVTADASSSTEQVALAQSKAALAAELVQKAEANAGNAMAMVAGEATRLSDALETSNVKSNVFSTAMATGEKSTGGFLSGITGAASGLLDFGMKASMTLMGVEMLGGMFMKVATAAGDMIGNFQQQMTKLTTTAGESTDKIKMVGDGILAMAGPTATSVKSLGDAMYFVEGGGAHGKKALEDLRIAAMGAKAENADLTGVTKALMFTLANYADTGLTAAGAMNTLITAVGESNMTLQDMSGAISNVMPTAHAFGISLTDVTAGLATMVMKGDDASAAATHLAMMIKTLEAPASSGAKALASIGLTTQQVTDEMRKSLPGALELIVDHLKNKFPEGSTAYNEALKNISGGSRSMQAILETTGSSLDTFKQNVDKITGAVKAGGNSIAGWNDVTQNFNFMVDQAKASVGAFGIAIGTALAPMLGSMIGSITSGVIPALSKFGQWFIAEGIPAIQQFGASIAPLRFVVEDLGRWFVLALKDIGPLLAQIGQVAGTVFGNIAKYMGESDQFGALLTDFETLGNQILRLDLSNLRALGPIVQGALGILGTILTSIVIPALDFFVFNLGRMYEFLNNGSVAAQLVKGALLGIGGAIAAIQIGAFVATIPALVAGFFAWAGAAGLAAVATIAATWPILAIGAAVGVVVAGIVLAVQHWGDIMGWITGKTEQTRIKVEEEHTKMAIAMDTKTADGAQKAINNMEMERTGILQKMKETNDPIEKAELDHQLKMLNANEQAQMLKLQKADEDKKKQLAKQKELHDRMVEAQKPWFARMWDGISGFFGNIGHWFTDRFKDAKNGIAGVFGSIGHWFGDRWHDIENIWGGVGQWFQDRFKDAKNGITGAIGDIGQWFQDRWHDIQNIWGGIGKWFQDRWNELPSPLKATLAYIGDVFQTLWNIVVALWGKAGAKFQEWWSDVERPTAVFVGMIGGKIHEAWNAVVGAFQFLGRWFGDRWEDTKKILGGVGAWFHDKFAEAWGHVTGFFGFLGKWFGDRWHDAQNILGGVGNWFHDLFQGAWNKVTQIWAPIGKWFSDTWDDVKKKTSDKWNEIKTDASNIFKGLINAIIDQLNNGISGIENFINFFGQGLDSIATSLGTKGTIPVAHLGRIPHYAEGTEAHPGGLMVTGEEGPELTWAPPGTKVVRHKETMQILAAMMGGKIPGYAGGIGDLGSQILGWISGGAKSILDNVISSLHIKAPDLGPMSNISSGIFDTIKNWALSWVENLLPNLTSEANRSIFPATCRVGLKRRWH